MSACGRRRKYATPEEAYRAKLEMNRRYAELRRIERGCRKCAGKRRRYATKEEAEEAKREYQRKYGKMYRELRKSGLWKPGAISLKGPKAPSAEGTERQKAPGRRGRRRKYATPEEAYQAKLAYQRKYSRRIRAEKKAGTWRRKNKVHSEEIARSIGVQTEKERLATALRRPPRSLFPTKAAWHRAVAARREAKLAMAAAKEERRQEIIAKYGFDPKILCASNGKPRKGCRPPTPEEREGWKAYYREVERAYAERNREKITAYNRMYTARRRARALAEAQKVWTAEEWAKWRAKQERKESGPGTQVYLVREVVRLLASQGKVSEDDVMEAVLQGGGLDFLIRGAESLGRREAGKPSTVRAAARALAFFLDPDGAVMFPDGGRE